MSVNKREVFFGVVRRQGTLSQFINGVFENIVNKKDFNNDEHH